jgi:hypothetical protein
VCPKSGASKSYVLKIDNHHPTITTMCACGWVNIINNSITKELKNFCDEEKKKKKKDPRSSKKVLFTTS